MAEYMPYASDLLDDPLGWVNLLQDMPATTAKQHRRTTSAPPNLQSLQLLAASHTGFGGKRAERSPRGAGSTAATDFDPFQDMRSPVYKKYLYAEEVVLTDDSLVSEAATLSFAERGSADQRARAHMLDSSVYELHTSEEAVAPSSRHHARSSADCRSAENSAERGSKTVPWTSSEDKVICEGVELHGFKWSLISMSLPGRTDNAVRNRWHRLEAARTWREDMHAQYQSTQLDGSHPAEALPGNAYPGYKCRRCGQPKRGHMCPYEDTSHLAAPCPLQPPQAARQSKSERARAQAPPAGARMHSSSDAHSFTFDRQPTYAQPHGRLQPPALSRPGLASISVLPPASVSDMRAAMAAGQLPTPSPHRYLLDHLSSMPMSAHLRSLDAGFEGDLVNIGDLEDLIFGALPIDLSELTANSPLKNLALLSPRRFARGSNTGPPPLASIPSGEPMRELCSMPKIERQVTPASVGA
ncbi:hypothetical protein T492DRAFT_993397 [Pavlovales sp. CCMP2436]|nr:hypothetical protein T492DRAFT_993397 [Pavlovales sp. CCMP2436]|eukprot:CAMPEP_0179883612 /NCGR_PEP_ID=MMETSP0982-20121206/28820_1 /TAXON_ID=483367 /ORGANISM="non described non described, Strain CCMP 2436" /LENGTH=469 /DNA_ID=CAMNT_0021778097 /DNA_START=32 /DNA_END=1441 /DNA_ORIENTATION=-